MIKVVATGDSLFCAPFPAAYGKLRASLDAFLSDGDVRITNLETNLSDFGSFANQYSGGTWLNTRRELFPALASFGFHFYGTANNHAMDYSYAGLLSTLETLNENGVAHAGSGKDLAEAEAPAVLRLAGGKTVAIFAVDASMERPSIAGRSSKVFAGRPGVNYLRHEDLFPVSEREMAELKAIAKTSALNAYRDAEIAAGYQLPDPEGFFVFGSTTFTVDATAPKSKCNQKDLTRLCGNIERAKRENDLVFILVHCHDEEGTDETDPPAYLKEFCRAAIDAGAHAVFGGGVHILRGLELYRGKPIFYSLGDFIYQGPLVEYLPPDFIEKYGLDANASAKEALWVRSKGGKVGLSTNEKNYLSVVPKLCFDDAGGLTDLSMLPIRLTFMTGDEAADGLPYFAVGEEGERVFKRFRAACAKLGTELICENGLIKVRD